MTHDGLKDGTYLCEVSGFEHTKYMVLRHNECGWFYFDAGKKDWYLFDCYTQKVVRYLTLLEEDKEDS